MANTMGSVSSISVLAQMAGQYGLATPQSQGATRGGGPVLAYVPTLEALELAINAARGSSLCVVEGFGQPIGGWAAAVEAEDLTSGEPSDPLEPALVEALESLIFYGNNGWGDQFGKQQAQRILARLPREQRDPEFIAGYVMGKGQSAHGAKNLQAIIEKLR
ncbi:hypothetical protein [Streptosporangium fragile]|uniref:hypothetical protein n=1 Tax=Streptosporangium fragile TaxID=46186 RepID=UPI0031EC09DD